MEYSRIRIKNFGPIKEGYASGDGWFNIKKVTVFIGNQGSGKSAVAKLISTLSWIEKALVRGDLEEASFEDKGQFEKHCDYQNIDEYFRPDSEIEYQGHAIQFSFKKGKTTIKRIDTREFYLPKIMYVPAERNLISAVRNVRNLKGLPGTLYTFSDEYLKAAEELRGAIELPINNAKFEYQKLNELASIVGADFKIRLMNASSGFQSLVPLYLVSKYLSESINNQNRYIHHSSSNEYSLKEESRLRKQINDILNNPNYTEEVKRIQIELLSSRLRYSSFLNIVEEPEQNLYPSSQQKILNELVAFNNSKRRNVLVMTTHSPYLINYLTLAVKAASLASNGTNNEIISEITAIVPKVSWINSEDLVIYELDERTGCVNLLKDYKGIPSDENRLNEELGEFNDSYARLLDLQQQMQ